MTIFYSEKSNESYSLSVIQVHEVRMSQKQN